MKISGTVLCPEYVATTHNGITDPTRFGFVMTYDSVLPELPCNTVLLRLKDGADADDTVNRIIRMVPSAMVLDRDDMVNITIIDSIPVMYLGMAIALPLLMFFVAMLIVISTLKRLIDSHRTRIGILKALGYTETRITVHYLLFAIIPTSVGCFVGMLIGPYMLEPILWQFIRNIYSVPYTLPAIIPFYIYLICILPVFFCRSHMPEDTKKGHKRMGCGAAETARSGIGTPIAF